SRAWTRAISRPVRVEGTISLIRIFQFFRLKLRQRAQDRTQVLVRGQLLWSQQDHPRFTLVLITLRMTPVPVPRRLDDGAQLGVARPPSQLTLNLLRRRHE